MEGYWVLSFLDAMQTEKEISTNTEQNQIYLKLDIHSNIKQWTLPHSQKKRVGDFIICTKTAVIAKAFWNFIRRAFYFLDGNFYRGPSGHGRYQIKSFTFVFRCEEKLRRSIGLIGKHASICLEKKQPVCTWRNHCCWHHPNEPLEVLTLYDKRQFKGSNFHTRCHTCKQTQISCNPRSLSILYPQMDWNPVRACIHTILYCHLPQDDQPSSALNTFHPFAYKLALGWFLLQRRKFRETPNPRLYSECMQIQFQRPVNEFFPWRFRSELWQFGGDLRLQNIRLVSHIAQNQIVPTTEHREKLFDVEAISHNHTPYHTCIGYQVLSFLTRGGTGVSSVRPMCVYRGLRNIQDATLLGLLSQSSNLLVPGPQLFKAVESFLSSYHRTYFSATTPNFSVASHFACFPDSTHPYHIRMILKFQVPEGYPFHVVNEGSPFADSQEEILLPPDSRWKVTDMSIVLHHGRIPCLFVTLQHHVQRAPFFRDQCQSADPHSITFESQRFFREWQKEQMVFCSSTPYAWRWEEYETYICSTSPQRLSRFPAPKWFLYRRNFYAYKWMSFFQRFLDSSQTNTSSCKVATLSALQTYLATCTQKPNDLDILWYSLHHARDPFELPHCRWMQTEVPEKTVSLLSWNRPHASGFQSVGKSIPSRFIGNPKLVGRVLFFPTEAEIFSFVDFVEEHTRPLRSQEPWFSWEPNRTSWEGFCMYWQIDALVWKKENTYWMIAHTYRSDKQKRFIT